MLDDNGGDVQTGGPVAFWVDGAGGCHARNANSSLQPVLDETGDLVFDGNGDVLAASMREVTEFTNATIILVAKAETLPFSSLKGFIGDNLMEDYRWSVASGSGGRLEFIWDGRYFPMKVLSAGKAFMAMLRLSDGVLQAKQDGITARDMITSIENLSIGNLGIGAMYASGSGSADCSIECVGILNRAISGEEMADLEEHFGFLPEMRFLFVGDSLSNDLDGILQHQYPDRSIDWIGAWVGGESTERIVGRIGKLNGISDYNVSHVPVVANVWGGANDSSFSASETYSNLKRLWFDAKQRGMKVVAYTVMRSNGIDTHGWEEERRAVNRLIRADEGKGLYDVLVDADAFMESATDVEPYYNDTNLFRDGTHMNLDTGKGCEMLCDYIASRIKPIMEK
jgi:hypothetical protein